MGIADTQNTRTRKANNSTTRHHYGAGFSSGYENQKDGKTAFLQEKTIAKSYPTIYFWILAIILILVFQNSRAFANKSEASGILNVDAPTNLEAYKVSREEILILWDDSSNGTNNFEIERKVDVSGLFEKIADVSSGITEFSDKDFEDGTVVFYRVRAEQNQDFSLYSNEAKVDLSVDNHFIPEAVKLSRLGKRPTPRFQRELTLSSLYEGDIYEVFQAPPCWPGEYYVGFKLFYDLGDFNTQGDWTTYLEVTFLNGEDSLWTKNLQVGLKSQTFLSTIFHDAPVSCNLDYKFKINRKSLTGPVPQGQIRLEPLFYNKTTNFNPSQALTIEPISIVNGMVDIRWTYLEENATLEYDVEWVYFEEHESFDSNSPFLSKEPVRITTGAKSYKHLTYYPTGKIYYRVRGVGYNPEFPSHRIAGQWNNYGFIPIDNQNTTKNWQLQTVYAEEGNYKKIMQYYDGSLRLRQSLTNLNSLGLTLVGESLYDFEGRKAIDIMPVPADNADLEYKENFNKFATENALVSSNTSLQKKKFHYDNHRIENSIISNTSGAGKYYSSNNPLNGIHKYIPDAEGYVYSQTVYTQDGTGRISKQAGPGKEFRADIEPAKNHTTRYFYGEAASEELKRLFGSNVGEAAHYKKNLLVDGNNQVSVSYLDQEGKVIATALAGKKPENPDGLESYENLDLSEITINISDKNQIQDGISITSHKIMNDSPGNEYTFQYDFSGLADTIANYGCYECKFDLKIVLTDPDGILVDLGTITDNDAESTYNYQKNDITAASCTNPTILAPVIFKIPLAQVGDYTLTKTLVPQQQNYAKISQFIKNTAHHQEAINQIKDSYELDASLCEACQETENCPESSSFIEEAMVEIAFLDCENLLNNIKEEIYKVKGRDFIITEEVLELNPKYCQYKFCLKNQQSDVFEKQLSRIANWDAAVSAGYNNALNMDPFFSGTLSGAASIDAMLAKLNNIFVANVKYDSNMDGVEDGTNPVSGAILQLTDPDNTTYYFDDYGNQNNNGKHILYWNLMSQESTMNPTEYNQALNEQRWMLYKSLYLEEKRKLKMELAEAQSCPALLAELRRTDELPWDKSEEEIIAWGKENYLYDSVSDEQLKMTISNIESACGIKLDSTEIATVQDELRNYFDSNDKNYFRFILKEDLGVNPNLISIENTLSLKGCSLDSIAVVDPLVCANDPILISNSKFVPNDGIQATYFKNEESFEENYYFGIELENNSEIYNSYNMSTLSVKLPSQEEYKALMDFYYSTNGPNWGGVYNTGWRDADSTVIEDVSNWSGVTTDSVGHVVGLDRGFYTLIGQFPNSIYKLNKLEVLRFSQTHNLEGIINDSIGYYLPNLKELTISSTKIGGKIPTSIGRLTNLKKLHIFQNQLTTYGPILEEIAKLVNLEDLWISQANLNESIPSTLYKLTNLTSLKLYSCKLFGPISDSLSHLSNLKHLNISRNRLYGKLPDALPNIEYIDIYLNNFTYSDFLTLRQNYSGYFSYDAQARVEDWKDSHVPSNSSITLTATVDRNTNPPCKYQWIRNFDGEEVPLNELSTSGHTITIDNFSLEDEGMYQYLIKNDDAPNVVIYRNPLFLYFFDGTSLNICLDYDQTNPTLAAFNFEVNWNDEIARCLSNQQIKDSILVEHAIEKYIQKQISATYKSISSNCLKNINESLQYKYVSREYHYTLYYYDQAKNLVQTVPPKGVHPITSGSIGEPQHTLTTRYRYNSLNQLVWQNTPDGGKSEFWYNSLGQLKLSRNAKQMANGNYSYSKYDALGRIVEVGEMESDETPAALYANLDNPNFPLIDDYPLHDIARTHYDRAHPNMGGVFAQTNLRNRVSWVEVIDNMVSDTIATYYSYDIHGNVKSLLQKIPGLASKRTDYLYDLVSGNVNYVIYQYDEDDQFVHRYEYDEDNRIREVYTSTDRYIWDKEAEYVYYQHGPLARVELGQYNVQNLDYTYTLQGWIKGVNMPYEGDPGMNGLPPSKVPKDAFAYTLGYFKGDYKAIGSGIPHYDTRDQLWARNTEVNAHDGLYNGNISWMVTDLPSVGQAANNRAKGMQAMLYKYDQLNRITKARSLTSYTAGSGFAARSASPAAYDVDYNYDPNGNLLTLLRRDQNGGVLSDYNYEYYNYTNRLKKVEGVIPDENFLDEITYYDSPLVPDGKFYERIYVEGPANVPANHTAELKATNYILLKDGFTAEAGGTFSASIIDPQSIPDPEAPDANYIYDEIGNLIADKNEGIESISWTAYGKIRAVVKKDGTRMFFRYDGSGNRVEKWIGDIGGYTIIQYVRDASGNVMAVYEKEELKEQPIYGSSRLGTFKGGRTQGHRSLGSKRYELSNHLGNVLAVVTDNINMKPDSIWASVESTSDYYPFGLNMSGRTWYDSTYTTYRYGFNGKEKDVEGMGGGGSTYDYGFRIYNPGIAKFLSVDPLTAEYPWYTPYQFAGNRPINSIDLDGLEEWEVIEEIARRVKPVLSRAYVNAEGQLIQGGKVVVRGASIGLAVVIIVFTPVNNGESQYKAAYMNRISQEDEQRYNDLAYRKSQGKLTDQEKRDFQELEDLKYPHGAPEFTFEKQLKNIYRGGSSLKVRDIDIKLDKNTGLVSTERGISVNENPEGLERFGGAYEVMFLPEGLQIKQYGKKGHYEIVPTTPITKEEYQNLLDKIVLQPIENK